jgi:hypothetical protein
MAIHSDYPGIRAEVVVNGEALTEYNDDGESPPVQVTMYVEAVSDAHFGVRYTIPKGLQGTCGVKCKLTIAGRYMCNSCYTDDRMKNHDLTRCMETVHTVVEWSSYSQKFRFSQLRIGKLLP